MSGKSRILVVDDDRDFIEATKIALESGSYEVSSAINGKEALEKIKQEPPDLIILDVMMDKGDEGFEVCRRIKTDPKYKRIPILMLTALASITGFDFKPQAGDELWLPVEDYVDKPVNPSELLSRVEKLLKGSAKE